MSEAQGFGRQQGHTEVYRGAEYQVAWCPRSGSRSWCDDAVAATVLDAIGKAAQTDKIGDGKIWSLRSTPSCRIRTGETGPEAL